MPAPCKPIWWTPRPPAFVADRNFHRGLLQNLAGHDREEAQARQLINEIQEMRAALSQKETRSMPLRAAAFRWLNELYLPIVARLQPLADKSSQPAELYCQLLEHKWYLSERAGRDVGHRAALEDFVRLLSRRAGRQTGG